MPTEKQKPTLLLVDDEEGIRRVLSIALEEMGCHVITAAGGREALDLFQAHEPAIVLADIRMPGFDGIDLLKAIKSRRPDTEVIMITGHGDMDAAILSLKLEATDFITKPIHEDALEIALKRARERIALRIQLARYTEGLERMVQEKTQQLIEAERMAAIGQTITGLSHTIKQIAGGLKGGAFGVEKGLELDNPRYLREGWNIVKGNVEKITRLSLDMIQYAKTTHPCRRRWCNPNLPLEEVAGAIGPRACEAGIALDVRMCPDISPVFFDPDMVFQALLNLAVNAIESFNGIRNADDPTIQLETSRPSGGSIIYRIIDNGCGMDQETQNNVCRRFFTTKGSSGTGIGLMMAKNIVDRHRGEMSFRSSPGRGTEVSVRLPKGEQAR